MAIEYALFTPAITCFIVPLSHGLGESAWSAALERTIGTVPGLAIVAVLAAVWIGFTRRWRA